MKSNQKFRCIGTFRKRFSAIMFLHCTRKNLYSFFVGHPLCYELYCCIAHLILVYQAFVIQQILNFILQYFFFNDIIFQLYPHHCSPTDKRQKFDVSFPSLNALLVFLAFSLYYYKYSFPPNLFSIVSGF